MKIFVVAAISFFVGLVFYQLGAVGLILLAAKTDVLDSYKKKQEVEAHSVMLVNKPITMKMQTPYKEDIFTVTLFPLPDGKTMWATFLFLDREGSVLQTMTESIDLEKIRNEDKGFMRIDVSRQHTGYASDPALTRRQFTPDFELPANGDQAAESLMFNILYVK